jgi:hypothetical protein
MASSSTNPTNLNFKIPSKNYSHTITTQILETSTNNIEEKDQEPRFLNLVCCNV